VECGEIVTLRTLFKLLNWQINGVAGYASVVVPILLMIFNTHICFIKTVGSGFRTAVLCPLVAIFICSTGSTVIAEASAPAAATQAEPAAETQVRRMFIREYRVKGAEELPPIEVGKAVYPYLGPGRTNDDVELARQALEAAYREKGFETVSVFVPPQQIKRGVVFLQVEEARVGKLRVRGSDYFNLEVVKDRARSMAEGELVNFNDVRSDIVAMNQWPDRRITPEIKPGSEPGTVDIDLIVDDTLPLHGRVELNNRQSVDTTPLRLNASLSYNNLWQLGHTIGFGYQVAPADPSEVTVFSGYYIARFSGLENVSLLLQGTKQDSNVSTLGGAAVAGNGGIIGARGLFTLLGRNNFFHSINAGLDYKNFGQEITLAGTPSNTPVTYYPFSVSYTAGWIGEKYNFDLNASVTWSFRGLGSDPQEFDANRFGSTGAFLILRADASHTHTAWWGMQFFAGVSGQASGEPLVSSEQFAGGGQDSVRGYLEAEVLGDSGIGGTIEVRSPPLLASIDKLTDSDWRVYLFLDGAVLSLNDPLPQQQSEFELASYGFGSRFKLYKYLTGSLDVAVPLLSQSSTESGDIRVLFRVSGDF